jgi:hypothetical protein
MHTRDRVGDADRPAGDRVGGAGQESHERFKATSAVWAGGLRA